MNAIHEKGESSSIQFMISGRRLAQLMRSKLVMSETAPFIPESAPFTAEQREWLNGFLAGMFLSQPGVALPEPTAIATKGRVPILFASQSGNAEGLAEALSERLQAAGFDAPPINAEDHTELDLCKETNVLVLSSTWGEGDPPDSAVEFWDKLQAEDHPPLDNLSFSVCGLGDTNYLEFCAMGKLIDARLEALGATRIAPRADCDVDFEEPADAWFASVLEKLDSTAPRPESPTPTADADYGKKNPFPAPLLTNLRLNKAESSRDTRHFEFSLEGSGLEYQAGDALGVLPTNCPEYVDDLLSTLGYTGEELVPLPDSTEAPVSEAFLRSYAITLPGKKLQAAFTDASGIVCDQDYLWGRETIDLFSEAPDFRPSPAELVSLLSKLQPRLYSISSSPKAHPGEVHLTVAAVRYESNGRSRKGVCSTFLADRCDNNAAGVFVHVSKGFRPPEDPTTKMIMVGPGTGIAPFRAFVEERIATGATTENWLFFGNPHQDTDFLYEDDLTAMVDAGHLRLDTAWSRDGANKIYVQHLMLQSAKELWSWLEQGAHFYVCGDAKRMAKDVEEALVAIIEGQGGVAASDYLATMRKERRYQRDVY